MKKSKITVAGMLLVALFTLPTVVVGKFLLFCDTDK